MDGTETVPVRLYVPLIFEDVEKTPESFTDSEELKVLLSWEPGDLPNGRKGREPSTGCPHRGEDGSVSYRDRHLSPRNRYAGRVNWQRNGNTDDPKVYDGLCPICDFGQGWTCLDDLARHHARRHGRRTRETRIDLDSGVSLMFRASTLGDHSRDTRDPLDILIDREEVEQAQRGRKESRKEFFDLNIVRKALTKKYDN